MSRQAVQSSSIKAIGYDPATRKLQVEFHDNGEIPGKVAEYDGVDPEKHAALLSAESVGGHFHWHIRGNEKAHPWRYL